jgi:transposase
MVELHQVLCAAEDVVFVDESGANITYLRTRGRAKAGECVRDKRPVNRGKNQTIVGALTIKGMQAVRIMDGAMTSERFDDWVIADLVPSLRPDQVVVLDNLRAHHSRVALEAIVKAGCHYLHLPPYSPEFNPIEQAWPKMKTILRRMALRTVGLLREGIIPALNAISAENALAWIRHTGWRLRAQVTGSPL